MIEKGHETDDTISDISSAEFYKIISRFWYVEMWVSIFLYIRNTVPKYTASSPRIQTHRHIINKFFISPSLTKCASKIILPDSVTLVPFHAPQLRPLFRGTVSFWLLQRNDDLAYIWQLIYLTRLHNEWPAPTRLCLRDMDIRLSKLLPWGVLTHVYEVTNARRSIEKPIRLELCILEVLYVAFPYFMYLIWRTTRTHTPRTHAHKHTHKQINPYCHKPVVLDPSSLFTHLLFPKITLTGLSSYIRSFSCAIFKQYFTLQWN